MRAVFCFAMLGSVAVEAPAWADFQLGSAPFVAGSTIQDGSRPIVLSPESPTQVPMQVRRIAPVSGTPIAHGFGNEVPLAFATRQIVPGRVRVTFGPGVDQAALVDWRGGRPWVETLQSAVRPLGFRVAVRGTFVSINRA